MTRRKHRIRLPIAAAVVVVVGGAGATYAVAGAEETPRYRTVAATTADVEQTLSSSGVVDAAARADLGFGTDGTVATLKVALGETVKAGQVLARLGTTELDAAVTEAEASVARAVAQLVADRAAQSAAVEQASNPSTGPSNPDQGADDDSVDAALLRQLEQRQDQVIAAQSAASKALAAARAALATQVEVCAAANAKADGEPAAEPSVDGSDPSPAPETPAADACATALAEVAERQQEVSDAQDALAKALDSLASVLTQALSTVGTSPSTGPSRNARTAATPESSADSDDTTGDGSSSPGGGTSITAARLAADQAQIEQARADLVSAQQAREQAVLRSTRSGKVVAISAATGDAVTAGSTVATVVGGTAVTVVGTATETQRDQLKVGQAVRVTVPGSTAAAAGRLTAIGLVADTSSGTTSYPFTVTVDDPAIALPTGSRALLQVVLATAEDVVTVPTSAVTRTGETAQVEVLEGSKVARKDVTLGAVGTRTVEVTGGLEAGQKVVLAAIDDPIEGAGTELNQRGMGGPAELSFRGRPSGGGGGPVRFTSGG